MTKLKPLSFDNECEYDKLINEIRVNDGVPLNRSALAEIATDSYVKQNIKNGRFDSRGIVQMFKEKNAERNAKNLKTNLIKRETKLKEKLAEIQKAQKEIKA